MGNVFLEAESFEKLGGWVVDAASMEQIHSAYVMAHGMGVPVEDAVTTFEVQEDGDYIVWTLTRDWTSVWDVKDPAGKYTILIDGKCLEETLGTNGKDWAWQLAGRISLSAGKHTIALHDLTGFNGRCDAVYITTSEEIPESTTAGIDAMRQELSWGEIQEHDRMYDLVVVGGGVAGVCTALTAMRSGVKVALIHDRFVLGGCNSSDIRVPMGGMIHLPPYPALGNIVKEIAPVFGNPRKYRKEYFEDFRKLAAFETAELKEEDYAVLLGECVSDIECDGKQITAVICTNVLTGKKTRIRGTLFSDCSGDGVLARRAGCEIMYGREATDEFGESLAPKEHQKLVMGHSIRWCSEDMPTYSAFPDRDWNLQFTDQTCLNCTEGDWEQEAGFTRDMVSEIEYIRDYGLRAIYANWAYQKHHFKDKEIFANKKITWISPVGGKREGYRVKGDYILTQNDIEQRIEHDDATASLSWSIDMHFPEPTNQAAFGEAFRSFAYHRGIVSPYPVPYRCLYAKDVRNLFIGGRLISASHVAFSSARVMRTLGQLGEVVGLASAVCKQHTCMPRDVYTDYFDDLVALMKKGVNSPNAFDCGVDSKEWYHFKDIGAWFLHTGWCDQPTEVEKFRKGVESVQLNHKYPMPTEWDE